MSGGRQIPSRTGKVPVVRDSQGGYLSKKETK